MHFNAFGFPPGMSGKDDPFGHPFVLRCAKIVMPPLRVNEIEYVFATVEDGQTAKNADVHLSGHLIEDAL